VSCYLIGVARQVLLFHSPFSTEHATRFIITNLTLTCLEYRSNLNKSIASVAVLCL